MIQSLKTLEQYLEQNNMIHTLQTMRAELSSKIPNKPSQQLLSLLSHNSNQTNIDQPNQRHHKNQNPEKYKPTTINHLNMKKKKQQLPVQGLLGKIAYSPKLLEDQNLNQKVNHLMDNKIFLGCLNKLFPAQNSHNTNKKSPRKPNQNNTQYMDELQMIECPDNSKGNNVSASMNSNNQISSIDFNANDQSQTSILSHTSGILQELDQKDFQEQYTDDRDHGYHQYVFEQANLMEQCGHITKEYGFPECAIRKQSKLNNQFKDITKKTKSQKSIPKQLKFPIGMTFPCEPDESYPLEYNGVSYDIVKMKVIYDREKIGYQEQKDIEFKKGNIIAGRYQVDKILGNGVFAKVVKAKDLNSQTQELTCFKMIQNNKDFFDQALDQIKLLRYVKANCDPNEHYLLNFKQAFYHREHLFIETDLLKDNLLTAFQTNPSYFSIPTIKKISSQILQALLTLHSMNIIHSDLKPENIMMKSYNPVEIRVIDLGNGCFTHDQNLGVYVQSRSYRAPQVVLGCGYNEKIDIWSIGCIIAELWTKNVLFYNLHIPGMVARIQSIVGPWPEKMLQTGQNVSNIFSKQNLIYFEESGQYHILVPKKTSLKNRIRSDDDQFIDFLKGLVQIDPQKRFSAAEALNHPFLRN